VGPLPPCLRRRSPQTPNSLRQLGVPRPGPAKPQLHSEILATPLVITNSTNCWSTNSTNCWSTPNCNDQRLDKGPFIKDIYTKSRKLDLPLSLSTKCPHWLNPSPLSVRTYHKFRKILSFFALKSADILTPSPMSALDKPPLLPDCGRLFMDGPQLFDLEHQTFDCQKSTL